MIDPAKNIELAQTALAAAVGVADPGGNGGRFDRVKLASNITTSPPCCSGWFASGHDKPEPELRRLLKGSSCDPR